jgi:hypothetical protein
MRVGAVNDVSLTTVDLPHFQADLDWFCSVLCPTARKDRNQYE